MTTSDRITLIGNTPSPYTRKMLALLRYRRIPYSVVWASPEEYLAERNITPPKVALLPTFIFEDRSSSEPYAMVDSTPIIRKLEADFAERSVIPTDPAVAFIDYLLEDFADEWCTKYMFHYRWHFPEDADNAGTLLPFCIDPSLPTEKQAWAKQHFSQRQIERLYVVGSNDTTAPIIDASYRRFLQAMEAHLAKQSFLLGASPSASDFALFGQLTQLVGFDPTPREIAHQLAPRTIAWTLKVEDLSGLEPGEDERPGPLDQPDTLKDLLSEIGRTYVPALLANDAALKKGDKEWHTTIDGGHWSQQTFPYQGKCLHWILEQYDCLEKSSKQQIDSLLEGTGCERLFD